MVGLGVGLQNAMLPSCIPAMSVFPLGAKIALSAGPTSSLIDGSSGLRVARFQSVTRLMPRPATVSPSGLNATEVIVDWRSSFRSSPID